MAHAQKPDFVFWRNGRVHLNRRGASVQLTTGSRVVRISGSNAGYTMLRGSVKSTGYPLHSPVSPSLPLPCVTVCHHISTGLLLNGVYNREGVCLLRGTDCNLYREFRWIFVFMAAFRFSRRPLTAEDRIWSRVSTCEICGEKVALGQGFFQVLWISAISVISSYALSSSSFTCCSIQKDRREKPVNLHPPPKKFFVGNRGAV